MKTDQVTKKSYDAISASYASKHVGPSRMFRHFLPSIASLESRTSVIDIGAGSGRDAMELTKWFNVVYCVDYSSAMLELLPKSDSLKTFQSDVLAAELDFPPVSSIWMNGVIHHMAPRYRPQLYDRLARWLLPLGVLYISFRTDLEDQFDQEYENHPRYYHRTSVRDVSQGLDEKGLRFASAHSLPGAKSWCFLSFTRS